MLKTIKVYTEKDRKTQSIRINPENTIETLLNQLGINKETVIVSKDGKIVLEKSKIGNAKKVDILFVVSGG